MHDVLHQWAKDWGHSPHSVLDLLQRLGVGYDMPSNASMEGYSETAVSQRLAIAAAEQGILSWRNNLGAMIDNNGRMVRFGLCNDTAALNKKFKSSDRVGIIPRLITPEMVGTTIGQAWFREVKEYGWVYKGTEREQAQLRFGSLVISKGADFKFSTGEV